MHKLLDYLCDELEELERKAEKDGGLSMSEIQYGDTLAHFKKNLMKADEMSEGSSYYEGSYARGRRSSRAGGDSSRRGYRTSRRNMNSRYDGMSYAEGADELVESINGMMGDLPQEVQREAQKFVQKLEQM